MSTFKKIVVAALVLISTLLTTQHALLAKAEKVYKNKEEAVEASNLELKGTPGLYPVTITYKSDNKVVQEIIHITVAGEDTVILNSVAINANPIVIARNQVDTLKPADWIELAKAKAWNIDTGDNISIVKVDNSQVKAEVGYYSVTFYTVDEISTTIQVKVVLDQETQEWIKIYQKNSTLENYEMKEEDGDISWNKFESRFVLTIQSILLSLLILPILALFLQYMFTRRLVHQVIHLMMKK